MDKDVRKPTAHNMKRRSHSHDYSRSGYYHITIARNTKEKQVFPWLFARLFVPLQRTTKKVVTKKIVIWRIPLSSEQL